MAPQTLPEFAPGRPAADVDAALRRSLAVCDEARRCAVLWFAEVQRRELWRALGHASLELYAVHRLGFSRNRYWQFKRLADDLDRLPALRGAVAEGRIGWTKAQQVARVATPGTDAGWVERAAQCGRRELAAVVTAEVARVRFAARALVAGATTASGADQLALGLGALPAEAVAEKAPTFGDLTIPATVSLRADALQVARFEALVEQVRKRGLASAQAGRMELVLAALERLVAAGCGAAEEDGSRATIPRRVRRAVLARDRHRCSTPGCGATAFLEVHHVTPRCRGGSNQMANLVTLCGRCHAFAHEGGVAPALGHAADRGHVVSRLQPDSRACPQECQAAQP